MSVTALVFLLIAVILIVALIQQLGVLPGLFARGTPTSQRLVGLLVFAIVVVLIVWLIGYFLPAGPIRLR